MAALDPIRRMEQLEERIAQLEAILKQAGLFEDMPEECRKRKCGYYTHYLAYGPPELTHEGYHAAEAHCAELQKRAMAWMDDHRNDNKRFPEGLDRLCRVAEARIRA